MVGTLATVDEQTRHQQFQLNGLLPVTLTLQQNSMQDLHLNQQHIELENVVHSFDPSQNSSNLIKWLRHFTVLRGANVQTKFEQQRRFIRHLRRASSENELLLMDQVNRNHCHDVSIIRRSYSSNSIFTN